MKEEDSRQSIALSLVFRSQGASPGILSASLLQWKGGGGRSGQHAWLAFGIALGDSGYRVF